MISLHDAGVTITIPHKLSRSEARRRIETGFANVLRQVPVHARKITNVVHDEAQRNG